MAANDLNQLCEKIDRRSFSGRSLSPECFTKNWMVAVRRMKRGGVSALAGS